MLVDLQLAGRRALITGGSRGIGRAVARRLALEGADCAICARTAAPLEEAARALAAESGRRVVPVVADLARPDGAEAAVKQAAAALGGVDILVNGAARASGGLPEDLAHVTDELILQDFEEKFVGYLRCVRAVLPSMRRAGWGRIVNIAGSAARNAGSISAGARNASVVHLTKTLAWELGPLGITVNAVHPGTTATEAVLTRLDEQAAQRGVEPAAVRAEVARRAAIQRLVTPDDVACCVAFLCSPLAGAITGEAVAVNGGADRAVRY
jgi:NAD(P)-dependent dehydrogenase (short-subunit alcohol dehydrogenase family)